MGTQPTMQPLGEWALMQQAVSMEEEVWRPSSHLHLLFVVSPVCRVWGRPWEKVAAPAHGLGADAAEGQLKVAPSRFPEYSAAVLQCCSAAA